MPTLAGKGSQEESRHAARVLRFLSTKDSTRALAKQAVLGAESATAGRI
jgi:hypothetical protein